MQHSGIPLVRDVVADEGILNKRQQQWMHSLNNQMTVENPVLIRQANLTQSKKHSERTEKEFVEQIRGLLTDRTEDATMETIDGGVMQKINAARKERHETAVEDMIQEIASINFEIEPQVIEICVRIHTKLNDTTKAIGNELEEIRIEKGLLQLSLEHLKLLWKEIEGKFEGNNLCIENLHASLEKMEENRAELLKKVFKYYVTTLNKIAFLQPTQINILIEDQIMDVNKAILENRKDYIQLIARLKTAAVEREKEQYSHWKERVNIWRELKTKQIVEKYKCSISAITDAPVDKLLANLCREVKMLNNKRLDLLIQLKEMKPPASTKTSVYKWSNVVTSITVNLDQIQQNYRDEIEKEQERLLQQCADCLECSKEKLLKENIIENEKIEEVTNELLYPEFGLKKAWYEYRNQTLEKRMTEVCSEQKVWLTKLYEFTKGAAHLWDNHELGLSKQERILQEMLDSNRRDHDEVNRFREIEMDNLLDKMRQSSSNTMLSMRLLEALELLQTIKDGYVKFDTQQKEICDKYPLMVDNELHCYTSALHTYFHIFTDQNSGEYSDVISLSNGKKYYINLSNPMDDKTVPTPEQSSSHKTDFHFDANPYIESFDIPSKIFEELRINLCTQFLEHYQSWVGSLEKNATSYVLSKKEEASNEFDLRLHLHEPRAKRIERDIHDARAGELSLHIERVNEHVMGVNEKGNGVKKLFQDMLKQHTVIRESFHRENVAFETEYTKAVTSAEVKTIYEQANERLSKLMDAIRGSIQKYRTDLQKTLKLTRKATKGFKNSFKTFCNGGNFSWEEVEEFTKQLEKSNTRLDVCETSLLTEIETVENKRAEILKEQTNKLEEKFKQHMFDVTFHEKTQRWLTNIQVKIKVEVALSNTQSSMLTKMLTNFCQQIENFNNPHPDRKSLSAKDIHASLAPLMTSLHARIAYLECSIVPSPLPKVEEKVAEEEIKPTKIKKKSPKNRSPSPSYSSPSSSPESGKRSTEIPNSPTYYTRRGSLVIKTTHGGRYDRKYMVFHHDENSASFCTKITNILHNGLDALLSTADMYFRQRGPRLSTRPEFTKDSFDACAECLVEKLKNYRKQTETFRSQSIEDLRNHVQKLDGCLQNLPTILLSSEHKHSMSAYYQQHQVCDEQLKSHLDLSHQQKSEHKLLLRPTLGHPNNFCELEALRLRESERQTAFQRSLLVYQQTVADTVQTHARQVAEAIHNFSAQLLKQYDEAVFLDDVIESAIAVVKKSEKELIKEMMSKDRQHQVRSTEAKNETHLWEFQKDDSGSFGVDLPSLTSRKKTTAHNEIIKVRDHRIKKLMSQMEQETRKTKEKCEKLSHQEMLWCQDWKQSLKKIIQLY